MSSSVLTLIVLPYINDYFKRLVDGLASVWALSGKRSSRQASAEAVAS